MEFSKNRRDALKRIGCATALLALPSLYAFNSEKTSKMMKRAIPSSGELLPIVGLGTWQTFDVSSHTEKREQLLQVLKEMKALGGTMIDSSPMYGSSEEVVGDLSKDISNNDAFFYATKVWTHGEQEGIGQMQASMQKMQRKTMDLMQIHNLVDWRTHVKTLKSWKEEGKIKYFGITHYTDDSHKLLEKIIVQEQPDFVQFNYAINDRHAEKRLLSAAKDNGTAVIINRPYNGGNLFRKVKGKTLPTWAEDLNIESWGQFFLKYILGHEAVNCVIPGTSKVKHVIDNMNAGYGRLPNENERKKMLNYFKNF